jgi:hypothetical protein
VGLTWLWPRAAWLALLLVGLSIVWELRGNRGWLRGWVPRSVGHTLLIGEVGPPPPRLLLILPASPPSAPPWLLVGAALLAALSAVILRVLMPEPGPAAVAALACGLVALWAEASARRVDLLRDESLDPGPLRALLARPLPPGVALACCSGDAAQGAEILVRNHRNRLPPGRTELLLWLPSEEAPSAVHPDGGDALPDELRDQARAAGWSARPGQSGLSRLRAGGWRATAMRARAADLPALLAAWTGGGAP